MNRIVLASVAAALALVVATPLSAASEPAAAGVRQTEDPAIRRRVQPVHARETNSVRDPNSPIALGDEVVFHDRALHTRHAGR
jgi:hypothetical protein